ncbi:hypothetical protein C8R41DRAFT_924373 [Lentinula lateritia]|uniref:Uncharacterized protein n=1 Tax=Lentinula lateritia TaxID=40482 RepID=A0ABQ8V5I8_9AGAR|nr:hypothetical protein C8R41DRAFT_924373 [Lentinula lateritia]
MDLRDTLSQDSRELSLSPILGEQQLPNVAEVVGSPVLFSHQLASQFELGDIGRTELSEVAKASPSTSITGLIADLFLVFSVLFKTHENQQALQLEVAKLTLKVEAISNSIESTPTLTKPHKDDILTACKLVVYNPVRIDFENDSIVQDGNLKEHSSSNSFKIFFVQESTNMKRVIKDHIRIQASYAKSAFRNARHFARKERPDLFDASKVKAKTRKPTKRARLDGDNFVVNSQVTTVSSSTIPILPIPSGATDTEHDSQNVETEEPESKAIAWASGFTEWINGKINAQVRFHQNSIYSHANFSCSFYEELIKEELLLFPQDLIPNIPRQRAPSVPHPTAVSSNATMLTSASNQNQTSNFFAAISNQAGAPRSSPSTQTSMNTACSNAPVQNPFTGTSSPAHSGRHSSTLPRPLMRSNTPTWMGSRSNISTQGTARPPFLDMLLNTGRPSMPTGLLGSSRLNSTVPISQGHDQNLEPREPLRASERTHSDRYDDPSSPRNDEHLSDSQWSYTQSPDPSFSGQQSQHSHSRRGV